MAIVNTPIGKMDSNSSAYKGYMASIGASPASSGGSSSQTGAASAGGASAVTTKPSGGTTTYGAAARAQAAQTAAGLAAKASPGVASNGAKIWQVGADGKAPAEAKAGDYVVTAGGTYKIGADGKGVLTNAATTTANYGGGYANAAANTMPATSTPADGSGISTPAQAGVPKTSGVYNIGTLAGNDMVEQVKKAGVSQTTSDGTVLSLGSDGNVYAKHPTGGWMAVQNNYNPAAPQADDNAALIAALFSALGSKNSESLDSQRAATDAAVQKAVGDLNEQKRSADVSYADLFRQLYLNKMRSRKNLDQQMGAQGVTGGAAESTILGLDTAYSDALRQGEIQRINTQAGLDQAIVNTRLNGDISYAQAAAEEARNRQDNYLAFLQNLLSRADTRRANADAQAADAASQNRSYAYQIAAMMLEEGNMPSDELLTAAGIRKADALTIVQAAADAKNAAAASEAGSRTYTQAQAQNALTAAIRGDRSAAVRAILEGYFGLPLETVLKNYGY